MDKLNFIIENPWVAVIIIPLLLFLAGKVWDVFRDKKNLNITIDQANQEFRTTIKRMVGDTDDLSLERLELLHYHTALRYNLKETRTESVQLALGSVIKEINDVPYLTYDIRNDYCLVLEKIYYEITKRNESKTTVTDIKSTKDFNEASATTANKNGPLEEVVIKNNYFNFKPSDPDKMTFKTFIKPKASDISWRLGLVTSVTSMLMVLLTSWGAWIDDINFGDRDTQRLIMFLMTLVVAMSIFVISDLRIKKRRK